jgi:proteasome lid subunit RPN8/RPN11
VRISRTLYDEIVAHARAADPHECCGLVAGRDGEATRVLPVPNVAERPERTYEMDPEAQHRAWMDIEDAGEDLVAIYHSHPPVGAYFSETDMKLAYMGDTLAWPGTLYIVVGLRPFGVRTFAIADHRATEVELEIVR